MKKLFSTLLTLVFILSFGSVAMATTPTPPTYPMPKAFTYVKSFDNPPINPAGTFNFTVAPLKVENYTSPTPGPTVPVFNPASFAITLIENGGPVSGGLTFPTYSEIGDYYYTITETGGDIAGVTYFTTPRIMKVVVGRVGDDYKPLFYVIYENANSMKKAVGVENDYDAGSLEVKKNVTGSFGNKNEFFKVRVTFNLNGKTLGSTIKYVGGVKQPIEASLVGLSVEIEIKDGETVTFTNIPVGVTWTVEEIDAKGHTPTYSATTGGVVKDQATEVTITNNLEKEIETGISLDSIPYIMILGLAVLGISGLFLRRRKNADF